VGGGFDIVRFFIGQASELDESDSGGASG